MAAFSATVWNFNVNN